MKLEDISEKLRDARFGHLTEDELDSYRERSLDDIGRARADAHLKLCFICERRLLLLKQESAALDKGEITAADAALVKRVMQEVPNRGEPDGSRPVEGAGRLLLSKRLAEYLRQVVASWEASFSPMKPVYRGVQTGKEVWRWQSEDGVLKAWAVLEKNADLAIHFSSGEPGLEGARIKVRLGPFSQEITLQRLSELEVHARFAVPKEKRRKNLAGISIDLV